MLKHESSQSREQSVLISSCVQYQVLRKAKGSIRKLEQTLGSSLKMKGNCMHVFALDREPGLAFYLFVK